MQQEHAVTQHVPVKVYTSQDRLTIAAPMPGIQPSDISVEFTSDNRVILHADLRGALKGEKDLIVDEWSVGPYHRDVSLSMGVDGPRANVTYDNGVLVVAVPLVAATRPARLTVPQVGEARGQRAGNAGRSLGAP